MDSIQNASLSVPSGRVAFIGENTRVFYDDLNQMVKHNAEALDRLRGATAVINGRARLELALLLFLLDGVAKRILFLPQDIEQAQRKEFFRLANVNFDVLINDGCIEVKEITPYQAGDVSAVVQTEWVIPTSGTTSTPKLVSHTFASLTRTAKKDIELGCNFVWGLVFDVYRFSGLQVLLQSLLSGSTLIVPEAESSMEEVVNLLCQHNCNTLSATPSFWRKMLMTKESKSIKFKNITLGGEIADSNILNALKSRYPEAGIRHIYASTEAGVGFSVNDGIAGFPCTYLDEDINGIKLKVDDRGILWLKPNTREQKYVNGAPMFDEDGFINTGDLVELKEERVYFLGRESGAINVGGNKVQPEEVERTILDSGLVSAAYVYAISNPMMGSLVCANIVAVEKGVKATELKKQVTIFCRERLENFKVPALLKMVEELEITNSGKLKR
ncbi:hypothetical protein PA25_03980 [Pseudoalteromonas sp. A25]|uniref:AMP-binding protein n=1 Tax=Pseudoalteromonas sp. A25 TaxID=116092 RepID=UPI001260CE0A|nr:AMP-binding protein [Pseudoalteromonas sp. A25]BBN80413.1 hypothetical protein PA25_03980 [Pseudoalteromonas sp. A25]